MSDLSASALKHLTQVLELQSDLAAMSGAAVLEHNYLLLCMGSFGLVVGRSHNRLRFDWDGREFFLNVQQCTLQSQSSVPSWQQLDNSRIAPPASAWPAIREHCSRAFGA